MKWLHSLETQTICISSRFVSARLTSNQPAQHKLEADGTTGEETPEPIDYVTVNYKSLLFDPPPIRDGSLMSRIRCDIYDSIECIESSAKVSKRELAGDLWSIGISGWLGYVCIYIYTRTVMVGNPFACHRMVCIWFNDLALMQRISSYFPTLVACHMFNCVVNGRLGFILKSSLSQGNS